MEIIFLGRMKLSRSFHDLLYRQKVIFENTFYMSVLQIFLLLYPLVAYPYLVSVLGRDLYGRFLTAQMLVSYASLIIDFGSNYVCAKHVSTNRSDINKLSEILSNVLFVRFLLFIVCFIIYSSVIFITPLYKSDWLLFLLTYGLTLNELLFPQFLFQGLEKMKQITIISVISKFVFVPLIFVCVRGKEDVVIVPILYLVGFFVNGTISLYYIRSKFHIPFQRPKWTKMKFYIKEARSLFATEMITTIKDKVNYLLIGSYVNMSDVVIYDLGLKLNGFVSKPYFIISSVLFPRVVKVKSNKWIISSILINFVVTVLCWLIFNIFLSDISFFFIHEEIDLIPLRLIMFSPVLMSVSYTIFANGFVALGYNKYVLNSIIITTIAYLVCLAYCFFTNRLDSLFVFVIIALISYTVELLYRLVKLKKILQYNVNRN